MSSRAALLITIASVIAGLLFPVPAAAHNVSKWDASFVQSTKGAAIAPFVYLGAKHMVTGYDHLARNGLITNIASFNVGVEIGQVLTLTAVLIVLSFWRSRPGFFRYAFATNTALMAVGFVLVGYQITGYWVAAS